MSHSQNRLLRLYGRRHQTETGRWEGIHFGPHLQSSDCQNESFVGLEQGDDVATPGRMFQASWD